MAAMDNSNIPPVMDERHGDYIHLFLTESEYTEKRETGYKEPWLSFTENKTITVRSEGIDNPGYKYFSEVNATNTAGGQPEIVHGFIWLRPEGEGAAYDAFTDSDCPEIGDYVYSANYNTGSGVWEVTYAMPDDTVSNFQNNGRVNYDKTAYQKMLEIPLTFEIISAGTIYWTKCWWDEDTSAATRTIEYKKNDGEWTEITSEGYGEAPTISVVAGDIVQFRGDNSSYADYNTWDCNIFTKEWGNNDDDLKYYAYGNIMSLIDSENYVTASAITEPVAFYGLFGGNVCMVSHNTKNIVLPAVTLSDWCYSSMFQDSTISVAPELPATTLTEGCYNYMFYGCSSLVNAPKLPARALANNCYEAMFYGCSSLVNAPKLPARTLASNCYKEMFYGCSSLVNAPKLPARTLADYCYLSMFRNCTNLTSAPSLPATALTNYCYQGMFYGCISLTSAPSLPATTLTTSCYGYMFYGCTSLTSAPSLPATALTNYCYGYMFYGCTSLTSAPSLPATALARDCYSNMFAGCTSLIEVQEELPATTLSTYCYYGMFSGCTSLTTAPKLPCATLQSYCYAYMFQGCTSLNYITCLATYVGATNCTSNWVNGVAESGIFIKESGMTSWSTGVNGIPTNWISATDGFSLVEERGSAPQSTTSFTVNFISTYDWTATTNNNWITLSQTAGTSSVSSITVTLASSESARNGSIIFTCEKNSVEYSITQNDNLFIPLTFEILSDGNIRWKAASTANTKSIEYKINDGNWTSLTSATGNSAPSIPVASGDTVQFRGNNTSYCSNANYNGFSGTTAQFNVKGNILSLVSADNPTGVTTYGTSGFTSMFNACVTLKSAADLALPNFLTNNCFRNMFTSCSALTEIPKLPATTLADYCYYAMFYRCSSLTGVPSDCLPAMNLASHCYDSMFDNCSSLTTAPELPATTLATYCYEFMFQSCAITNAPALPATALTQSCYYLMFSNCKSLTVAPVLPATTLAGNCYKEMFYACSGLTDAPALPATELVSGCYTGMFSACNSLTGTPSLPATTLAGSCYYSMFSGCTSLTSLPVLPATELAGSCYRDMFRGCSSLTGIPSDYLPALNLASTCYDSMFAYCTGITQAPELPATTLADYCYRYMFLGCKLLTSAPSLEAEYLQDSSYEAMFSGCTALNHVRCLATKVSNDDTLAWLSGVSQTGTFEIGPVNPFILDSPDGIPRGWTIICDGICVNGEDYAYVPESGATVTIDIYSQYPWTATTSDSWLSVSPLTGQTGNTTVTITANAATSVRDGNIEFSCSKNNVNVNIIQDDNAFIPLTFDILTGGTIKWKGNRSIIKYKLNNGSWTNITATTAGASINVSAGDTVQFIGDNVVYSGRSFSSSTAVFNARGNVNSLIKSTNFDKAKFNTISCFNQLFRNVTTLVSCSDLLLPQKKLTMRCYEGMFSGCTSLTTAPELPATTLGNYCYTSMFMGCTAMTSGPSTISVVNLGTYCCASMFSKCQSLTVAPTLPAVSLSQYCYSNMFNECTSLTASPTLPATTLADGCYSNMFSGCTSLTNATSLPATTLANSCYSNMFVGCTGLTSSPALPATTIAGNCYFFMFSGCTSLVNIPETLPATVLSGYCYYGMFAGCTSLTQAPALPATTLANSCYQSMFRGCTSLTESPALSAGTLVTNCYAGMFSGCSNLAKVTCLATNVSVTNGRQNWLSGVKSSGTFIKSPNITATTWGRNASGIPSGWSVQNAT